MEAAKASRERWAAAAWPWRGAAHAAVPSSKLNHICRETEAAVGQKGVQDLILLSSRLPCLLVGGSEVGTRPCSSSPEQRAQGEQAGLSYPNSPPSASFCIPPAVSWTIRSVMSLVLEIIRGCFWAWQLKMMMANLLRLKNVLIWALTSII